MNAVSAIRTSVIASFLNRCAAGMGDAANMIRVFANPTEEIDEALRARKPIKMFARGPGMLSTAASGARARLEENYLFDTRRFADGTGAGGLVAGEYQFFANAIGQPGVNNGFVAGMVMSEVETNMDVASQIPQGKDYVLTSIGVSFNAGIIQADAVQLLDAGALRFSKQGGQFTLKHGPINMWPGGQGLASALATASAAMNGIPDIRATRKLAVPRVLRSKDTFNYSYLVPRSTTNLDFSTAYNLSVPCCVRIWLWGGQQDAIPV